jgi:exonuclease SbcD
VPSSVFGGVDYAALGHLHGRQVVTESVRYSGSPLAYSFSEADHIKGSWLVQLGADGFERADFAEAPVPRRLAKLRGELEDLLEDPSLSAREDCWVQAVLTDPVRPAQAMERIRNRFPHTLVLSFEPGGRSHAASAPSRIPVGRSDHDITLDFVEEARGTPASDAESTLLLAACDSCRQAVDDTDQVLGTV